MANFHCNPTPYLPPGAHVEDGWQRPARGRVALGGEPPRRHEDYAVITLHPEPAEDLVMEALHDVVEHLEHEFPVRILFGFHSPLGLGLVQFQSASQRQTLIDESPIPFINNSVIRVIKHDEARNLRACNYSHFCRLMVLAFPLDYQNMDFFKAAVAPFGRLITWYESPNKSKTILDCLVLSPDRIPRSVVVSQGSLLGGNGRSWTAPVYIIGGQFPDVFPGDEDPVPLDGIPHPPPHGHIAHANPDVDQNWIQELAGAGNAVLNDHGINQQQMQQAMADLAPNLNNANNEDVGDAWPEWEVGNAEAQHPAVPQHPEQQQDTISFNQSGSSANFLRANGPDIQLTVEMILKGKFVQEPSSSSSSGEVSSVPVFGAVPAFSVHWPAFDMAATPSPKRSWSAAFEVGQSSNADAQVENSGMAIVPYQPVLHSVLLQIWAQKMEEILALNAEPQPNDICMSTAKDASVNEGSEKLMDETTETAEDEPTANADSATEELMDATQSRNEDISARMITDQHNVQAQRQEAIAKKCLLSSFDVAAKQGTLTKVGCPPRPPKTVISMPTAVSVTSETVPLVAKELRRSPRLNKNADGYKHCQIEDSPRKKRKGANSKSTSTEVSRKQDPSSLQALQVPIAAEEGPIPIEVLKKWGVECGVPPEEVTEDLLLQKRPTGVPDDNTT
ncbi:unnamed protein product [Urochloa humidicola]